MLALFKTSLFTCNAQMLGNNSYERKKSYLLSEKSEKIKMTGANYRLNMFLEKGYPLEAKNSQKN